MSMKEIGKRLKELRKENGYTLEKLAEIFNNHSKDVTKSAISRWENGSRSLGNITASLYSKVFNVSLDWLVNGTEPKFLPTKTEKENKELTIEDLTDLELQELNQILTLNSAMFFNKESFTDEQLQELKEELKKTFLKSIKLKRETNNDY